MWDILTYSKTRAHTFKGIGNYKLSCLWSFDSCIALRANLSAFILASSSRIATASLGIFCSTKMISIAGSIFRMNIPETCAQDLGTTDPYTSSQNQLQPQLLPHRETYRHNMLSIPFWITEMNQSSNRYEKIEREFEDLEIGSSHNAAWEWRIWIVHIWLQLPMSTKINSYVQILCGRAETFGFFHLKVEDPTELIPKKTC